LILTFFKLQTVPGQPPVKIDSLVIFTNDGMQHLFFDIKYFKEFYCVLDHLWRNPKPTYEGTTQTPVYSSPNFINNSLKQQMEAYQKILEYKQSCNQSFSQQQFDTQQQQFSQFAGEFYDPDFFHQQQNLQQDAAPLYPVLQ